MDSRSSQSRWTTQFGAGNVTGPYRRIRARRPLRSSRYSNGWKARASECVPRQNARNDDLFERCPAASAADANVEDRVAALTRCLQLSPAVSSSSSETFPLTSRSISAGSSPRLRHSPRSFPCWRTYALLDLHSSAWAKHLRQHLHERVVHDVLRPIVRIQRNLSKRRIRHDQ